MSELDPSPVQDYLDDTPEKGYLTYVKALIDLGSEGGKYFYAMELKEPVQQVSSVQGSGNTPEEAAHRALKSVASLVSSEVQ